MNRAIQITVDPCSVLNNGTCAFFGKLANHDCEDLFHRNRSVCRVRPGSSAKPPATKRPPR